MPEKIVVPRSMVMGLVLALMGFVAFMVVRQIPDIQREIKIWMM